MFALLSLVGSAEPGGESAARSFTNGKVTTRGKGVTVDSDLGKIILDRNENPFPNIFLL